MNTGEYTVTMIFWISFGLLFYVYIGFAGLAIIVGGILNRRVDKKYITPKMTLIIAAYNEESSIADRLENALELDYPKDALEIIVASDGSSDNTDRIVTDYADRGVKLVKLPRRGKIHALTDAVLHATGEVLVFSDANSFYERMALRELIANFADPEVGGVCGNTIYSREEHSDSCSQGETLYWEYDKWLKQVESATGSIISADGTIYAVRRELYRPGNDFAVTDDFAISTGVIEQGFRLVFEQEARAYEYAVPVAKREFSRKVRIMTRGLRGVISRKNLFNPFRYGFYSIILFTHKVLRRLVFIMLITLCVSNLFLLSSSTFFASFAMLQLIFYILAGVGYLLHSRDLGKSRILYIPFFYCMANLAALIAVKNVLQGQKIEQWEPQRHNS